MLVSWLLFACVDQPNKSETEQQPEDDSVARADIHFQLPLEDPTAFDLRIGMDHDPANHDDDVLGATLCTDYLGRRFPHCYDDHMGTDYMLIGGFETMDEGV